MWRYQWGKKMNISKEMKIMFVFFFLICFNHDGFWKTTVISLVKNDQQTSLTVFQSSVKIDEFSHKIIRMMVLRWPAIFGPALVKNFPAVVQTEDVETIRSPAGDCGWVQDPYTMLNPWRPITSVPGLVNKLILVVYTEDIEALYTRNRWNLHRNIAGEGPF